MLSCTVIVAVQVLMLPPSSVTVKVTVFEPTSAQVKSVWSNDMVMLQLSDELLFTCSAVMEA